MRAFFVAGLAACAISALATDVGIFSDSRLAHPYFNVQTGPYMSVSKSLWEARGAVWHQTSLLTPAFLSGVQVFFTSKIGPVAFTDAEVTAITDWVHAGGTLIITGDCG